MAIAKAKRRGGPAKRRKTPAKDEDAKAVATPGSRPPTSKRKAVEPPDTTKRPNDKSKRPRNVKAADGIAPSTEPESTPRPRQYWLMKAEPNTRLENGIDISFSIDDLASKTVPEPWDGIRNHMAKNNILSMRKGDLAFFYHSNCKVPGIVGTMEIVSEEAVPDETAFDSESPYHDPKSDRSKPRWFCPLVEFRRKLGEEEAGRVTLESLKKLKQEQGEKGVLAGLELLRMSRLSVSKVSEKEWEFIMSLAEGMGRE